MWGEMWRKMGRVAEREGKGDGGEGRVCEGVGVRDNEGEK